MNPGIFKSGPIESKVDVVTAGGSVTGVAASRAAGSTGIALISGSDTGSIVAGATTGLDIDRSATGSF